MDPRYNRYFGINCRKLNVSVLKPNKKQQIEFPKGVKSAKELNSTHISAQGPPCGGYVLRALSPTEAHWEPYITDLNLPNKDNTGGTYEVPSFHVDKCGRVSQLNSLASPWTHWAPNTEFYKNSSCLYRVLGDTLELQLKLTISPNGKLVLGGLPYKAKRDAHTIGILKENKKIRSVILEVKADSNDVVVHCPTNLKEVELIAQIRLNFSK